MSFFSHFLFPSLPLSHHLRLTWIDLQYPETYFQSNIPIKRIPIMRINSLAVTVLFALGAWGLTVPPDNSTSGIAESPADMEDMEDVEDIDLGMNATALPHLRKCTDSNRCDYGQTCWKGRCMRGCYNHKDCAFEQKCDNKKNSCTYLSIFFRKRKCHLDGSACGWSRSCCSGACSDRYCVPNLKFDEEPPETEAN